MAIVTSNEYDHIDVVNGSNTNRHYIKDATARNSIEDLKSNVNDIVDGREEHYVDVAMTSGYYIKTGNTKEVNLTPVSDNTSKYAIIDCAPGDIFALDNVKSYNSARAWAFIEANNAVIEPVAVVGTISETITAPVGAAKVIFNNDYSSTGTIKKYVPARNGLKQIEQVLNCVTPEMYGASGDGTEDDTQAVQAAIDAGYYVKLEGVYKITSSLLLHSNLILDGNKKGSIIKAAGDNKYPIFYQNTSAENVTIDGLSLSGLQQWTGVTVSGDENDFGIKINGGKNIVVSANRFAEFGACAISIDADDVIIKDNTIAYTGSFTGDLPNYNFGIAYDGQNYMIQNNKVSGVIQGIISGLTSKNTIICDNDISTNGQHGIYTAGCENVVFRNNFVHDCSLCGIKIQLNDNTLNVFTTATLEGNIIENCGAQGILVTKINGIITPNKICVSNNVISNVERGIELSTVNDANISNNIISVAKANGYGISITNANDVTIIGNKLYTIDAYGIYFDNDSEQEYYNNINVTANTLKATKSSSSGNYFGIRLNAMINGTLNSNIIIASGEYMDNTDGVYIANDETTCVNLLIMNNIIHGYRWDLRALKSNGCVASGNSVTKITGIVQT